MTTPKIVDTNVAVTANLALDPEAPIELVDCIRKCVCAIESVILGRLVLDQGDEIFDEYRNNLSLAGQPGQGDKFMKWVHDHRWGFPEEDRVPIKRVGNTYDQFPTHEDLVDFDPSDRKFVAVANAHPAKPTILEATDCKWWGCRDSLAKAGISVTFLCEDWIREKYVEKMDS